MWKDAPCQPPRFLVPVSTCEYGPLTCCHLDGCRLAEEGGLLGTSVPGHLRERKALSTLQMETIHEDGTDDLHHVAAVIGDEFGLRPEQLPIDVRSQARLALIV